MGCYGPSSLAPSETKPAGVLTWGFAEPAVLRPALQQRPPGLQNESHRLELCSSFFSLFFIVFHHVHHVHHIYLYQPARAFIQRIDLGKHQKQVRTLHWRVRNGRWHQYCTVVFPRCNLTIWQPVLTPWHVQTQSDLYSSFVTALSHIWNNVATPKWHIQDKIIL